MIAVNAFKRREKVADWRAGMVASVIANVNRSRGRRAFRPEDFMPREHRPQTAEDQIRQVEMLNALFGGRDLRRQNDHAQR